MDALAREGLVRSDRLTFVELRTSSGDLRAVNLRGRIDCCDDVVITVNKWLDVSRNARNQVVVRGRLYGYHAWVRGTPRRNLLRYDNAHASQLHRHFFDDVGREIGVVAVSLESLPRLDLVIREAVALVRGTPLEDLYKLTGPEQ